MNKQDAMQIIVETLYSVCNKQVVINDTTDLLADNILDSLDAMVFIMEIENRTGKKISEDINLIEEGYYRVPKLVEFIVNS